SPDRFPRTIDSADNWNIRKSGFWRRLIPSSSRLVHGHIVPNDGRAVSFAKQIGYEMSLVPVLRSSRIRDSLQRSGRWSAQISPQYRFPDHEYPDVLTTLFG